MLVLRKDTHETIWGGSKLSDFADIKSDKIGHLYSCVSNAEFDSTILNGQYKDQHLSKYFKENKNRLNLDKYNSFPLVIALVDASDNLSIQVHPNNDIAKIIVNENCLGKNESWYFLNAPDGGSIFCGCNCKDLAELKQKILTNDIESCVNKLAVKKLDYVYVEAGTLHAMATGSLVYEIEENAGATYRFYDFNRTDDKGNKRQLHIANGFIAVDVNLKSSIKHYENGKPIEEKKYYTTHYESLDEYTNTSKTIQIVTIIKGELTADNIRCTNGNSIILEPNEAIDCRGSEVIVAEPKV